MAIAISKQFPNKPIWVNDKYFNLYCFWIMLQTHGEELQRKIIEKKDIASCFLDMKWRIENYLFDAKRKFKQRKNPLRLLGVSLC